MSAAPKVKLEERVAARLRAPDTPALHLPMWGKEGE